MSEEGILHAKFFNTFIAYPIIYALVNNNIAEELQESAKTVEELCESTEMQPDKLFRYLRLVSTFGLFSLDPETNKWSNTKDSLLLTGKLGRSAWLWCGNYFSAEISVQAEAQLFSSKPPMEALNRPDLFVQLANNPDVFTKFQTHMTELSLLNIKEVVEGIIIEQHSKVLDVGGADGTLVIGLAKKYENASFGIFDRPEVNAIAQANIESNGFTDRMKFYSGNFFEEIENGFDVIVLKHIIHDWNDEKSTLILKNCRKVLKEGDKLFVIDHLVDSSAANYSNVLTLDYLMITFVGGKERTVQQFKALFDASGFEIVEIRNALFEVVIEVRAV